MRTASPPGWRFLLASAILLLLPVARAQTGVVGTVEEVANPLRVRFDAGVAVPLGATVFTLRGAETPSGTVGVLSGTYTVVQQTEGGALVEVAGDGAFAQGGPRLGDRVEVEGASQPSSVRIASDPPGAAVSRGGYPIGHTPLRVDVAQGAHTFVISATGYEPATLAVQAPAGELLSETRVVLSRPPPATTLFESAEVAFHAGQYDEAEALLSRARENADASLTAEQTAALPSLAFAAGLGTGIAARGPARGLTPAAIKTALSQIRFVHAQRAQPDVARVALRDLEGSLAGDPALATVRALLPPASPTPAP